MTIFSPTNQVRQSSVIGNPWGFTGRRNDPETGLMYYRNRYYSPELGRFISRDPAGFVDGMNLYYAYFAPNGLDPDGTSLWDTIRKLLQYGPEFVWNWLRGLKGQKMKELAGYEKQLAEAHTTQKKAKELLEQYGRQLEELKKKECPTEKDLKLIAKLEPAIKKLNQSYMDNLAREESLLRSAIDKIKTELNEMSMLLPLLLAPNAMERASNPEANEIEVIMMGGFDMANALDPTLLIDSAQLISKTLDKIIDNKGERERAQKLREALQRAELEHMEEMQKSSKPPPRKPRKSPVILPVYPVPKEEEFPYIL